MIAVRRSGIIACRNFPLVYCNIPKSGCTTIKNVMHRIDTGSFLEDPLTIHSRTDLLVRSRLETDTIEARLKTDFVFTFVRNPLSRGYSCFNEKIATDGKYSIPEGTAAVQSFGANFSGDQTPDQHRDNFKAFLRLVNASTKGEAIQNPHWLPQMFCFQKWVFPCRMPDFFGKVENLNKEMEFVLRLVGSDFDMATCPRMNEGPPPPFTLAEIIDDEIVELAKTAYSADLRGFGYSL